MAADGGRSGCKLALGDADWTGNEVDADAEACKLFRLEYEDGEDPSTCRKYWLPQPPVVVCSNRSMGDGKATVEGP